MEIILSIIKKIVFFMIMSNIMTNLISNETYKKYIKVYTGICLIIMVVTSVNEVSSNIVNEFNYDIDIKKKDFSNKYKDIILKNLSKHMKGMNAEILDIELKENYEINSVHIIAYEDNIKKIKDVLKKYYMLQEKNIRIESAYGSN